MTEQPLVSIIMNCYNSDTYLKETLDCVFAQTYQNWEIIFWDNQSTDKSAEIVQSFKDPRLRYFYAPEHTPLGEARNLAIDEAKGEWIAILDADDLWHPGKLEAAFALLARYPQKEQVSLLYSKTEYIDSEGKRFGLFEEHYSGEIHDKLIMYGDFVFISSAIFRTDILRKAGKIDISLHYAEDYDILLKVTKSHRALCVDAFHTSYRVHADNLTSTKVYAYDVENFEFLNKYARGHNLSWKLRYYIFWNNSKRMTASIVKLAAQKDYISIKKILKSYPQYMLLSPYIVSYFLYKRVFKLRDTDRT